MTLLTVKSRAVVVVLALTFAAIACAASDEPNSGAFGEASAGLSTTPPEPAAAAPTSTAVPPTPTPQATTATSVATASTPTPPPEPSTTPTSPGLGLVAPDQAISAFFNAFEVADFPLVYRLLDSRAQSQLAQVALDFRNGDFTGLANEPAWDAINDRLSQLSITLGNASPSGFGPAQIVLEEATANGALPVDVTAGISNLAPAESQTGRDLLFTATLSSTGQEVEIHATQIDTGEWRVRRIGLVGSDPRAIPFAGPADATSALIDPANVASVYDEFADDTPEAALEQFGLLASNRDWFGTFLMMDQVAQSLAPAASTFNERWFLTPDGFAQYVPVQYELPPAESLFGPFRLARLLDFGAERNALSVPFDGFTITDRRDSQSLSGQPVATLEAEHVDIPGQFMITMVQEQRGWRLRQIRTADGAPGRIPFSADADIEVWSPDGEILVPIESLRAVVEASLGDVDEAALDDRWAEFVEAADQPGLAGFRKAFVRSFGADDSYIIWIDMVDDELPWLDIRSPQEVGRSLAASAGIEGTFSWDYQAAITRWQEDNTSAFPIEAGLAAFDSWLSKRDLRLVGIHSEYDEFIAVAVRNPVAFIDTAEAAGLSTYMFE